MGVLLLILLLCFYYLAKKAWMRWREDDYCNKVSAVVTENEFLFIDLAETEPMWKGSMRHQHDMKWIITLKAGGKSYCVETDRIIGALYRKGHHTTLYFTCVDGIPPVLSFQRAGIFHFILAVLLCLACAAGLLWYAAVAVQTGAMFT